MPTIPFLSITPTNFSAIEDVLRSVNGRSTAHTLTSARVLANLAQESERALTIDGEAPVGAIVVHISGGKVAAAYKYSRILTRAMIARTATDWVLVDVARVSDSRAVKYWLHPSLFAAAAGLPWATRRNCVPADLAELCNERKTELALLLISCGVPNSAAIDQPAAGIGCAEAIA